MTTVPTATSSTRHVHHARSAPTARHTPTVRRGARHTLADAFAADPWAAYVLGAPGASRPRRLAWVMAVPVALADERGGLLTEGPAAAPTAVSTWVPLARREIGPVAALRTGAALLPLAVGPAAMRRLLGDQADLDRVLAQVAAPSDGYLWVLGVRRSHHGQGLGRVLVERTCEQAARRGLRRLVLNTDNPANVALYRRLGFELAAQERRPSGLTAHVMVRDLQPQPQPRHGA